MPIDYKKNQALFRDIVSVEEAEGLLEWLQNKPPPRWTLLPAPICTPPTCKC